MAELIPATSTLFIHIFCDTLLLVAKLMMANMIRLKSIAITYVMRCTQNFLKPPPHKPHSSVKQENVHNLPKIRHEKIKTKKKP